MEPAHLFRSALAPNELASFYRDVRRASRTLAAPLSDADATVQSMPDASPAKWHLAHTTWFFESFVLAEFISDYEPFDSRFSLLFNSYYEAKGARISRPSRGLLTRPSLDQVMHYRAHVDTRLQDVLAELPAAAQDLIELGCHHEEQHQELLLTDLLHLFSQNPLEPTFRASGDRPTNAAQMPLRWVEGLQGAVQMGHDGSGFSFD